jgi:two-component system cell cycle sensor histidine kinase/response regulator CckA
LLTLAPTPTCAALAHDLRNLALVALAHCELEEAKATPGSSLAYSLSRIRTSTEQTVALCTEFMSLTPPNMLGVTPRHVGEVDLNEVVTFVDGLLVRVLSARVHLHVQRAAALPLIRGKVDELQRALLNLCLNARDAVLDEREATIWIRTSVEDRVIAEGQLGATEIVLSVEDNGCGMDEATRGKLFEEYFTTKVGGHGLGLRVVHSAVESAGGRIEVQSTPEVGSVFRLIFPTA